MNDTKPVDVPDAECLVCGAPFQSHRWFFASERGVWRKQHRATNTCSRAHAAKLRQIAFADKTVRYDSKAVCTAFREWKVEEGCARCGYNTHHSALQCDHIDRQDKAAGIARLMSSIMANGNRAMVPEWKVKELILELAKCQVLCANCHSIKTFENQDWKGKD